MFSKDDPRLNPPVECIWSYDDDGLWNTACGKAFCFNDGGTKENEFRFCPYCGKPIDPINEDPAE